MQKFQLVFEFGGLGGIILLEALSVWLPTLIHKNLIFYLLEGVFLAITITGTVMKYNDR